MPLPILQTIHQPRAEDLVRLFHRTELHWTRHLSEETVLDAGVAFTNSEIPRVWDANRLLDAALPAEMSAAAAMAAVQEHFSSLNVQCAQITMNPAATVHQTSSFIDHLLENGWRRRSVDILHLAGAPTSTVREVAGLTIIPARATFRHSRLLAEEDAKAGNEPQLADATMLHLDDGHWDAVTALKNGVPVGSAGVLAVGDIGRIDKVFVSERFRRQGIGRTLVGRALEICARSVFRHIMLPCAADNIAGQSLLRGLGFQRIGEIVSYRAPWTLGT